MLKNYTQLITGIAIGLLAGLLLAKLLFVPAKATSTQPNSNNGYRQNKANNNNTEPTTTTYNGNESIPQKVIAVLAYIKANNQAMQGYVGGRVFTNREKVLPQTDNNGSIINYQEWDVNPKVEGQNRGAERICTGSDDRSWYTNNHYKTFTQIK